MAEPLGLIGAAGVAVQIGDALIKLKKLRDRYKDAHNAVNELMKRLTNMKSVLGSIQDLVDHESISSPNHPKVQEALVDSITGCREAVESLDADISMFEERTEAMGISDRLRYLNLEKDLREREFTFQTHMAALQVSLQAVLCTTYKDQTILLTKRENVVILQRAADEKESLRASRAGSTGTRTTTPSVISSRRTVTIEAMSVRGSVVNDVESVTTETPQGVPLPASERPPSGNIGLGISDSGLKIKTTPLDKSNLQHHTSTATRWQSDKDRVQAFVDSTPVHKRSKTADDPKLETHDDEGYETKSATDASSYLSPSWTPAEREFRPYQDRGGELDTADIYRNKSLNTSGNHVRTKSDPFAFIAPLQQTSPKQKPVKRKLSLFSLRRSRTPSASSLESLEEEPVVRRRRSDKESESTYFRSIDFGSPDGLSAPQLVRAAQSGSVPEVEQLLDRGAPIDARHQKSGKTALAVAAHCGNDEIVALLIQNRANVDSLDKTHSTPLHLAASRGHSSAMRHLIHADAHIEERDSEGRTPLWLAARHGYLPAVQLLISRRAKVNTREGKNQTTPLHAAAILGDVAMTELLLQHGAHIDAMDKESMAAIHHACERGHEDVVKCLLQEKASVESKGYKSQTPLITAAAAGQHHLFDLLLGRKAQLKAKSEKDMNALHWASRNGHVEAVQALLKTKKLSVDESNADGHTPLHLAIRYNQFGVVELLLRVKCDIEKRCNGGYSPLHYSCASKSVDITRILVTRGALLEKPSVSDRAKPIHVATAHGDIQAVRILLERRVSLESRDVKEERPLCVACRIGHLEIVEALLEAGSPVRAKYNIEGWSHEDSPLCIASRGGHLEICSLLISKGASVRQHDEYDWQPLRYAAYYGHPEVVELLLQHGAELGAAGTGWGFEMTASRIGFSNETAIPSENKERVLRLLDQAEQHEAIERKARVEEEEQSQTEPTPQGESVATELMDRQNSTRVRREILERRPSEVPDMNYASNVYPAAAYDPPPPPATATAPPRRAATTAGRTLPPPVKSVPLEGNPSPYNSVFDSIRNDTVSPSPAYPGYGTSPSPAPFSTVSSISGTPAPATNNGLERLTRALTQLSSHRPSSTSQISRTLSGGMRFNSGISAASSRDSTQLSRPSDIIEEESEYRYDNPDSFNSKQHQQYPSYSNDDAYLGVSEMPDTGILPPPQGSSGSVIFEMPDTSIPAERVIPPTRAPPLPPAQVFDPPPAYDEDTLGSREEPHLNPSKNENQTSRGAESKTRKAELQNPLGSVQSERKVLGPSTREASTRRQEENQEGTSSNAGVKKFTSQERRHTGYDSSLYDVSQPESDAEQSEGPPEVILNRINSDNVLAEPILLAPRLRRFSFEQGDDSGRSSPDVAPPTQPRAVSSSSSPSDLPASTLKSAPTTTSQPQNKANTAAADTKKAVSFKTAASDVDEPKRRSDQEIHRRLLEDMQAQRELDEQFERAGQKSLPKQEKAVAANVQPVITTLPTSSVATEMIAPANNDPNSTMSAFSGNSSALLSPTSSATANNTEERQHDNESEPLIDFSSDDDLAVPVNTSRSNPLDSPPNREPPPPPVAASASVQRPPLPTTQPPPIPRSQTLSQPRPTVSPPRLSNLRSRPLSVREPASPPRPEQDRQGLWDAYRRRAERADDPTESAPQVDLPGAASAGVQNRALDWAFATDEEKIAAGGEVVFLDGVRYVFAP